MMNVQRLVRLQKHLLSRASPLALMYPRYQSHFQTREFSQNMKMNKRKILPEGRNNELFLTKPKHRQDEINMDQMRSFRLNRLRDELSRREIGACLFYDPVNIRYALDTTNMSIFTMQTKSRFCFIPVNGPTIMYEFLHCEHVSKGLKLIDEIRSHAFGDDKESYLKNWSGEIESLMRQYCGSNKRLALDTCDVPGYFALSKLGIEIIDGKEVADHVKKIKSEDEITCMKASVEVSEIGIELIRNKMKAGMTEEELWAYLHKTNIENGGEWLETRLLTSGVRTNPWMYECSNKIIEPNDIVALDTDMVGPYGYCSDISRTFVEGHVFTPEQKKLYEMAVHHIDYNAELIKPGVSFREFIEKSFQLEKKYIGNRYTVVIHGVGLTDEYPFLKYPEDFPCTFDDHFQQNMCVCVESYVGEVGGREGVKLEQQYVVREHGLELLSHYPLETF